MASLRGLGTREENQFIIKLDVVHSLFTLRIKAISGKLYQTLSITRGALRPVWATYCCQGLSEDFKNAYPKQQFQISARPDLAINLIQILLPTTFNSLRKANLHFSYVLEDGSLGKYLIIAPQKSKLQILYRNFCLSKKRGFQETASQSKRQVGRVHRLSP